MTNFLVIQPNEPRFQYRLMSDGAYELHDGTDPLPDRSRCIVRQTGKQWMLHTRRPGENRNHRMRAYDNVGVSLAEGIWWARRVLR